MVNIYLIIFYYYINGMSRVIYVHLYYRHEVSFKTKQKYTHEHGFLRSWGKWSLSVPDIF